eukprot:1714168-Pleurochrysis_carterae.AAC.1
MVLLFSTTARPKSASLGVRFPPTSKRSTLADLRSWCSTAEECRYAMPSAMPVAMCICADCSSGKAVASSF